MSAVTSILAADIVSSSRGTLNTNFQNLNADKVEVASAAQVLASTLSTVAVTPSVLASTDRWVFKNTDESTLTSVISADSVLRLNVGANEAWALQGAISFAAGNTVPDMKWGYTVPAGTTFNCYDVYQGTSFKESSPSVFLTAFATDTTTIQLGTFIIGSVAGSITAVWAQNTHTPSSVATVLGETNLHFKRIK